MILFTNIESLIAIGDVIDIFLIFPCSEYRSIFRAEMLFEAIYFFVFAIIVARSNQMKEHHWLSWCWLYLLLCNNLFLCQVDSCRKVVFLEATEDAALQNHSIRTIVPSVSEHFCRVQCYLENECMSYNYGQETCQLNNSTAAEHPLDLKAKPNFIYRGIQNSCSSMPCLNHGTCQSGFDPDIYRCFCTPGFTGTQFDKDIDECASGKTNPCQNGGTCINVVGAFQCQCPEGFIGARCKIVVHGCASYITLNASDRSVHFRGRTKCDNNLTTEWYRFQGEAGRQMATTCPPTHRCNTDLTGWMNGKHPNVEDGIVKRQVCFHGYSKCCYKTTTIDVRSCGAYFVYRLRKVSTCTSRYCGTG
ncbi:uromodulin-like isoform X1 [Acropora palmata]|uniref:uromodulin-like isoform X1 n=1 Tax=Acropora palmata TaxID=6131 RepID=UPI003DA0E97B